MKAWLNLALPGSETSLNVSFLVYRDYRRKYSPTVLVGSLTEHPLWVFGPRPGTVARALAAISLGSLLKYLGLLESLKSPGTRQNGGSSQFRDEAWARPFLPGSDSK